MKYNNTYWTLYELRHLLITPSQLSNCVNQRLYLKKNEPIFLFDRYAKNIRFQYTCMFEYAFSFVALTGAQKILIYVCVLGKDQVKSYRV